MSNFKEYEFDFKEDAIKKWKELSKAENLLSDILWVKKKWTFSCFVLVNKKGQHTIIVKGRRKKSTPKNVINGLRYNLEWVK